LYKPPANIKLCWKWKIQPFKGFSSSSHSFFCFALVEIEFCVSLLHLYCIQFKRKKPRITIQKIFVAALLENCCLMRHYAYVKGTSEILHPIIIKRTQLIKMSCTKTSLLDYPRNLRAKLALFACNKTIYIIIASSLFISKFKTDSQACHCLYQSWCSSFTFVASCTTHVTSKQCSCTALQQRETHNDAEKMKAERKYGTSRTEQLYL